MSKGLIDFFVHGHKFKKEVTKQIKNFIVVGAGFTIAFTWRQTIFDISEKIVIFLTHVQSSSMLSLLTSVLTTLVSILIVFLAFYFLKEQSDDY